MRFEDAIEDGALPIVAILRGIETAACVAIAKALVDGGIRLIEVPFNSPDPVGSIRAIEQAVGTRAAVGGGTVTSLEKAEALAGAGGTFMVSPNVDPQIIARALALGLDVMPGFLTPTEAFSAITAGARNIKLFPGSVLGSSYPRALRDVLPPEVHVWAVGGVGAANVAEYVSAGIFGIGAGSSLFKPGDSAATVGAQATELVAAWRAAKA
ncbi:2-dehydro-3-deoxy-6-phosphogalactonate aldolase [Novosphingobium sp. ZN18A2]|uniref:2-dehydro-3-deoxy-6-phosphogalactonate aldolase n=1 Tax=Novosphingobium sp. ZN18A2 TaxID=3079861 RepID=UPI0030CDF99D